MNFSKLWEIVKDREACHAVVHGVAKSQTWLSNWTTTCEIWVLKNWRFWTVVEKTVESPLDCKEIQPVHSKGESWVFFGRTDAEAETPILWPPHAKNWLIGKDSDAGRDWGQEEKGTTEDEMAGWHHGLDGREFEWTPGVGDGQGGPVCCNSWDLKSWTQLSDWTELNLQLTNTHSLYRRQSKIFLKAKLFKIDGCNFN